MHAPCGTAANRRSRRLRTKVQTLVKAAVAITSLLVAQIEKIEIFFDFFYKQ